MTQDDIILIARKAGIAKHVLGWTCWEGQLERFAQLIAQKCAEIAETAEPYQAADLIRKHFGVEE
jgi:hypothetical protein